MQCSTFEQAPVLVEEIGWGGFGCVSLERFYASPMVGNSLK